MIDVISYSVECEKGSNAFWVEPNKYVVRISFSHNEKNLQQLIDAGYVGSLECLNSDSETIIVPIVIYENNSFGLSDIVDILQNPTMALIQSRNEDSGLRNFATLMLKTFDTSGAFEITLEEPEISTSQE